MFGLFKTTFDEWNKDHAPRLGAALAYYMIFSLGPLFLILLAILGLVFGPAAAKNQLVEQFQGVVGIEGARFIQDAIAGAAKPSDNVIGALIGFVILFVGALGVFLQLQDALNSIWGVAPRPHAGLHTFIRNRVVSFAMLLAVAFLLLASLVVQVVIEAVITYLGSALPFSATVVQGANFFASLAIVTVLFALIFKVLPDAQIAWRDVWIGAMLTSLLFLIGRFALSIYLAHSAVADVYGAAGSLILVLLWIYYSAQILFFGAEFTKVYATRHGRTVVPAPNAERITEQVEG